MSNQVGKYHLGRKLATGGMAEVFLAKFEWARGLEKNVVVKRILYHLAEDPSFIDMFFTEAQLAAQLSHPNIAQIIEFGESEGVYFLAMEYIDGPSLRALSSAAHAQGNGLPFPACARIAAFCCEALAHAHEITDTATGKPLNLVHRDVSPDNILVSKSGSVKLVDFGIAKAATQNHQTKTGLVKGKLAYMAPEQLRAEPLDCRADVFSLGAVLYELIAGHKPYEAPSEITLIHAMLYEPMTPLRSRRTDVPPELERIVNKALERDRERRYRDCREMHADLEDYLISSRQAVSALQIAQLVEKYRAAPGKAEGTPSPAMATPNRQAAPARTPEPWKAERTPALAVTAELRPALQKTGTDGEPSDAPPACVAAEEAPATRPLEKTEVIPAPKPLSTKATRASRPSIPSPASPPQPAAPSPPRRRLALASAGILLALVLIAGAIALLKQSPTAPSSPAKKDERAGEPKDTVTQAPMAVATEEKATEKPAPPAAQTEPPVSKPSSATPPAIPPKAQVTPPPPPAPAVERPKAPPTIQLDLKSEPPGMIKVTMGGRVRANSPSPLTIPLPPGVVDLDVSGTGGQSFQKHEQLTLDLSNRKVPHTITVVQGTLMIRSFPPSHVKIDGVLKGDVPLKISIYEGPHTVQFECDKSVPKCAGVPDATQPVVVLPGKTAELVQRWP